MLSTHPPGMTQHVRSAQVVQELASALGPGPWTVGQVLAAGWSRGQLRSAVTAGRLVRPHKGAVDLPSGAGSTAATARAALLTLSRRAALSHSTAGTEQRLWLPRRPDPHEHVTAPGDADDLRNTVRIHGCSLPEEWVTVRNGVRMTSPARTAVDLARGASLPDALIVLDSFLRLCIGDDPSDPALARGDELRREARRRGVPLLEAAYLGEFGWPGTVVVRDGIPLADAGSESPLESWSRGVMIKEALPRPVIGAHVQGASGAWYWVDFLWAGAGVIGEADGIGKHGTTDDDVRQAMTAERRRQADLEAAGYVVIRWTWSEPTGQWLRRLRRALGRA